jgi:hypothetical protein
VLQPSQAFLKGKLDLFSKKPDLYGSWVVFVQQLVPFSSSFALLTKNVDRDRPSYFNHGQFSADMERTPCSSNETK